MEKYIGNECSSLLHWVSSDIGKISRNKISDHVNQKLEDLLNDMKPPQGQFYRIIQREIRHTLSVYREIAGFVEQAMVAIEEKGVIVVNESKIVQVSKVRKLWTLVARNITDMYDWDLSESAGEQIDILAKMVYSPIAIIGGIIGGFFEFLSDHRNFESNINAGIREFMMNVKEKLRKSENEIKKRFMEEIKSL
jgi:hypothetical protein